MFKNKTPERLKRKKYLLKMSYLYFYQSLIFHWYSIDNHFYQSIFTYTYCRLLLQLLNLYVNLTLWIYFLKILKGQLVGSESLILFINSNRDSTTLISVETIFHSLEPKLDKAFKPLSIVFTIGKLKSEQFLKL